MSNVRTILLIAMLGLSFIGEAYAQVETANYFPDERKIRIVFADPVIAVNLNQTLIYYEDVQGSLVQLWSGFSHTGNVIELSEFRTGSPAGPPTDLTVGITPGGKRDYFVVLKEIKTSDGDSKRRLTLQIAVRSAPRPPLALLRPITEANRKELVIQPIGIPVNDFLAAFRNAPEQVLIAFDFNDDDVAMDYETSAASVELDPENSARLLVTSKAALQARPETYSVTVRFPANELRGKEESGFKIPDDEKFLQASREVKLRLNQPKRAASEYYFEATFASTVKEGSRGRTNVGIFGVHLKPTIQRLSWRVSGNDDDKPTWLSVRPLLEADFDTLPVKSSKSPNRTQFGVDFELGRSLLSLTEQPAAKRLPLLQYFVWVNGARYDSDRDFKLQTAYWRTEFIPHFLNFEKDSEQRLREFRYAPDGRLKEDRKGRQPLVSAYHFRPSIGYELGGVTRKDLREASFPSDTISRLLGRVDASLEFKRVARVSLENSYYFLKNIPNHRHRNYTEARFEVSTGYLLRLGASGIQSAISLKFQSGEQPPTFEPVNALSIGFKLFR